jgi:hypothetical protein
MLPVLAGRPIHLDSTRNSMTIVHKNAHPTATNNQLFIGLATGVPDCELFFKNLTRIIGEARFFG